MPSRLLAGAPKVTMKLAAVMAVAAVWIVAVLVAGATQGTPSTGKDSLPEVDVVLRVSRKLVSDLTTEKVSRTTPVQLCVMDTPMTGVARTQATATVQYNIGSEVNVFVVHLQGTSVSRTVVDRPPVQVYGTGRIDFTIRKRVTFDGLEFRSQPSVFEGNFCTSIDGVGTPPGLIGLFIGLVAGPRIEREAPIFAQAGFENGKSQLMSEFDKEVDKVIKELNDVSPLEKTITTLFPETANWIYYPTATATHMVVGLGPRGRRLPELPITEKNDAPIEVWIRRKPETQGMIAVLNLWRNANRQLEEMLPPRIGKSLTLGEGFKTMTVKDWFVIQLGKGEWKDVPKEAAVPRRGPGPLAEEQPIDFNPPVVWRPAAIEDPPVLWRPARP
jgi:hypothetical protein